MASGVVNAAGRATEPGRREPPADQPETDRSSFLSRFRPLSPRYGILDQAVEAVASRCCLPLWRRLGNADANSPRTEYQHGGLVESSGRLISVAIHIATMSYIDWGPRVSLSS
jgi:hypothetical protein